MQIGNDKNNNKIAKNNIPNDIYDWRYTLKDSAKGLLITFIILLLLALAANFLPDYTNEIRNFFISILSGGLLLLMAVPWVLKWLCIISFSIYLFYFFSLIIRALEKCISTN